MSVAHVLKLAGKFVARGFVFKAGKKAALKGGKTGIGIFSILAGGFVAYRLLQKREERLEQEKKRKISRSKEEPIVV
jgi:hypothetical protein